MTEQPDKQVHFVITAVLHTDGTFRIDDVRDECHLLTSGIQVIPVVNIIGELDIDNKNRLNMMALHTLLTKAAESIKKQMDAQLKSSTDIPAMPPTGGVKH